MSYVYAAPPPLPPVPVEQWRGLKVTWTGWDGGEWELSDYRSGVLLRGDGVEGLNMPPHTPWTTTSPAVHGQYYRGHVVDPREVFWPVLLYSNNNSEEWLGRDRAFWRSLHPGKYGKWTVATPASGERSLTVRFADDGGHTFERDPVLSGWASYGVTLVADDPFWYGSPRRRTWAQSPDQGFYVPPLDVSFVVDTDTVAAAAHGLVVDTPVRFRNLTGTTGIVEGTTYYVAGPVTADTFKLAATPSGAIIDLTGVDGSAELVYTGMPLFRINSASQLGSATLTNEGDVEAWPVWTGMGPFTSVTVGVAGSVVEAPIEALEGQELVIDTDPTVQMAWLDGVDVTEQLGAADFAPIPAGEDRDLSLSMVGTGSVMAEIKPRFYRAW